ncbi:MAG: MopE-related protein [Myxococcota bacterium]
MALPLLLLLAACGGGIGGTPDAPKDTDTDDSPAQLVLDAELVDFGEIPYGEVQIAGLNISNPGGLDLALTTISIPAPFTVSPPQATLSSGGHSTITVTVTATTYEDFAVDLTIITDSDDVGTVTIPVMAATIRDVDGDGYDTTDAGGDDCDDDDADVNPGAEEEWYDGEDQNCDDGNDFDRDGDGYDAETDDHHPAEPDCNDTSTEFHPGQTDEPYDGRDTNCDGENDYDADGDGSGSQAHNQGYDCDDDDPDVNRDGVEQLNGKDDNCDEEVDNASLAEHAEYIYDADGSTDRAGYSLALGDLNDDGYAEILVGNPYAGTSAKGTVSVFYGGSSLAPTGTDIDRADNYLEGTSNNSQFGSFVSVVGDFDGDGTNDVALGEPAASSNGGNVYLVGGYETLHGDQNDALAKYTGSSSNYLGRGMGTDIDLDGDGLADLVMPYYTGSYNAVAIEYGGASPTDLSLSSVDARYTTDGADAAFYRNAPVGGDFDGDGYDDLVLSDSSADYGSYTNNGAVWVLWGQTTRYAGAAVDIETAATVLHSGASASAGAGMVSQMGEDADGDGADELWIADTDAALYMVEGGSRSPITDIDDASLAYWDWGSSSPDASGLRRIGDWSGDGVDDMILYYDDGYGELSVFSSEGRGYLEEWDDVLGDVSGSDDHTNGNVGYGMAPVGMDVDGDGDDDYALGDPEYGTNKGEAYLIVYDPVE